MSSRGRGTTAAVASRRPPKNLLNKARRFYVDKLVQTDFRKSTVSAPTEIFRLSLLAKNGDVPEDCIAEDGQVISISLDLSIDLMFTDCFNAMQSVKKAVTAIIYPADSANSGYSEVDISPNWDSPGASTFGENLIEMYGSPTAEIDGTDLVLCMTQQPSPQYAGYLSYANCFVEAMGHVTKRPNASIRAGIGFDYDQSVEILLGTTTPFVIPFVQLDFFADKILENYRTDIAYQNYEGTLDITVDPEARTLTVTPSETLPEDFYFAVEIKADYDGITYLNSGQFS